MYTVLDEETRMLRCDGELKGRWMQERLVMHHTLCASDLRQLSEFRAKEDLRQPADFREKGDLRQPADFLRQVFARVGRFSATRVCGARPISC
eukprot:1672297-Alexandrium_andersonii.AAC.1